MNNKTFFNAQKTYFSKHSAIWIYHYDTEKEEFSDNLFDILGVKRPSESDYVSSMFYFFPEFEEIVAESAKKRLETFECDFFLNDSARFFSIVFEFQYEGINAPVQATAFIHHLQSTHFQRSTTLSNILHSLANFQDAIVFMTDKEGHFTFLSGMRILGIDSDDWIGRSIFEYMQGKPDKQQRLRKAFLGEVVSDESIIGDKHFLDRFCPIYSQTGEFQGLLGIQLDVTKRVKIEEQLNERTDLLNNLFNCIPDHAYVLDLDYTVLRVNKAAKISMPTQTEVGQKCYKTNYGRTTPCTHCPIQITYQTEMPACCEYYDPRIDKYFELTSFPIIDQATGKMIGATEFARDITIRKNIEESVTRSERLLNDLMEKLSDAVYLIDTGYTIHWGNKAFQELYPDLVPLIGRKCYETTKYGRICPDCAAETMFREGRTTTRRFYEKNNENESGIWLELSAFPQYEMGTNRIIGAICIVRNVTSHVELQNQVDQYRQKIRELEQD